MNINDILSEESILVDFNASSKKHVLDCLSKLVEREIKVSYKTILDNLIKREKLGSTAVGNGVAIPHTTESSLDKPKGFLAKKLSTSIENQIDSIPNVIEERAIWQRYGF